MHQLILYARDRDAGFVWRIVEVPIANPLPTEGLYGSNLDLNEAVNEGLLAFRLAIGRPEPPARHEWTCHCGVELVLEARRSKKSPYSWDSPREITCNCGTVFGVKLNFAPGRGAPFIEALER